MHAVDAEKEKLAQQFEHEKHQKHEEFQSMVECMKIKKQTTLELKQLEPNRLQW